MLEEVQKYFLMRHDPNGHYYIVNTFNSKDEVIKVGGKLHDLARAQKYFILEKVYEYPD